jgi:hypothetical protein
MRSEIVMMVSKRRRIARSNALEEETVNRHAADRERRKER